MKNTARLESPEQAWIEEAATQYLTRNKNWKAGEFRIEPKGSTKDGRCIVVWAIHVDDENAVFPGGGKSLALHLDPNERRVISEFRFQ